MFCDGLVGTHDTNRSFTVTNPITDETTDRMGIIYWRADALVRLLGQQLP